MLQAPDEALPYTFHVHMIGKEKVLNSVEKILIYRIMCLLQL